MSHTVLQSTMTSLDRSSSEYVPDRRASVRHQEASTFPRSCITERTRMTQMMHLPTLTTTSSPSPSPSPSSSPFEIENFIGIWLHMNAGKSNTEIFNHIRPLQCIINFFKISIDVNQCINDIRKVRNEKVFLIVSGSIGQISLFHICEMTQVVTVYIFCWDKSEYERWHIQYKKYGKVRGVFTRIEDLSNQLKADVRLAENALTPFSVIPPSSTTDINKLDSSFISSRREI
jgi:hypothetical protein